MMPQVLFMMSDNGHDPTETAVPYTVFKEAGLDVHFATENGKSPSCDKRMLTGVTGALLGAQQSAITLYNKMKASEECQSPLSWTASGFSLDDYNIIILPGGHDKAVRQAVDSPVLQALLVDYFPKTRKPSNKAVGAICHGVLALSNAKDASGQSVIHSCDTTTLPGMFESSIFWGTRLFLGDYYKTYGAGSENVEDSVRKSIKDDKTQFKSSILPTPFVVQDSQYNYVSARFPPDAEAFAKALVELVQSPQ